MRSEHLIDRYSPHHALTIVCGYDVDRLGDVPVAEAACVHARTGGMPCSFLLHATDDDGRLGLAGEVDRSSAPGLGRAITTIAAGLPAPWSSTSPSSSSSTTRVWSSCTGQP
ncbi:hypothetical protein [Cellulomonas sp. ATA003]|uniref:hypothetical protein n=1 Tax=Cellulomonas sp. ATA003 TaxID=3073064 RepID=UPI002873BB25|nr:hypothetical protein [Cellulomonas sp. ATA003]WNB87044.1 hypothetical protein REH70_07900 [Cellulomonas sp. ATA003]